MKLFIAVSGGGYANDPIRIGGAFSCREIAELVANHILGEVIETEVDKEYPVGAGRVEIEVKRDPDAKDWDRSLAVAKAQMLDSIARSSPFPKLLDADSFRF
jgi:hypothetical protein